MSVSVSNKVEEAREQRQLNLRKKIRAYELEQVIKRLPPSAKILEIGAGAGWQARELSSRGFQVEAIDIPESNYVAVREWEVTSYDGFIIPFADKSFDVVFSSNVLEHVPHVESFQTEIRRVLKDDGIAVHVMPSTVWRTLTFLSFYPDRIKKLFKRVLGIKSKDANASLERVSQDGSAKRRSLFKKLGTMLIPPRHGETANALAELYLFSSYRWKSCFLRTGWSIQEVAPCGLFYSGQKLFGELLNIPAREALAKNFGSSCTLFVLRKA